MEKNESGRRFPVNLFCSLLLPGFVPFLYTLVRTNLIADSPSADGLGIAGHIEWFDLINETIQAFLIVNVAYILFSVFILVYCSRIVSAMTPNQIGEVTGYLRLETIGFVIGNVVSFANVLFVVLEKPFCIYAMVVLKTTFTIIGDLFSIPQFGVNGVAYSNIAVSFRFEKPFLKKYGLIGLFGGAQILLDNLIYQSDCIQIDVKRCICSRYDIYLYDV